MRPHVDYFYKKMLRVYPPFAEAPGYRSIESLRAGMRITLGTDTQRMADELKWKDYVEQGHIIAGSPATVRDQLKEAIKNASSRPPDVSVAHRDHAERAYHEEYGAVRQRGVA